MDIEQLALILKENYKNAAKDEKVYQIHLFGIKYADEIEKSKYSLSKILALAALPKSYFGEIRKGIKLAKYFKFNDSGVSTESLGMELKNMYKNAPDKEMVTQIHIFSIKNAAIIQRNNFKVSKILKSSGIPKSYITELHKGPKLSNYVSDSAV
jgi:hypothetical protein